MEFLPSLTPASGAAISACGGAIVFVSALIGAWRARGSTAVPAAIWAAAASGGFTLAMLAQWSGLEGWSGPRGEPATRAAARLVVSALAVCPAMSLLGAKRPQHGVWQVIVASLAVVIAMPAATAALVRPGSLPDVHPVGRVFLAGLVAAGWLNFLGTGKTAAAALVTLGIALVVRPFLPGVDTAAALAWPWADPLGSAACAAGSIAALIARGGPDGLPESRPDRVTAPLLALRDTIGIAWTLRIAERFNAVAESRGWPCRLSASGLSSGGDPLDHAWHLPSRRLFESLMRRFVSRDWLARHGGGDAPA